MAGQTLMNPVTEEVVRREIAERAYQFYEARGCQDGHDLQDWLRAEKEILAIQTGSDTEPTESLQRGVRIQSRVI